MAILDSFLGLASAGIGVYAIVELVQLVGASLGAIKKEGDGGGGGRDDPEKELKPQITNVNVQSPIKRPKEGKDISDAYTVIVKGNDLKSGEIEFNFFKHVGLVPDLIEIESETPVSDKERIIRIKVKSATRAGDTFDIFPKYKGNLLTSKGKTEVFTIAEDAVNATTITGVEPVEIPNLREGRKTQIRIRGTNLKNSKIKDFIFLSRGETGLLIAGEDSWTAITDTEVVCEITYGRNVRGKLFSIRAVGARHTEIIAESEEILRVEGQVIGDGIRITSSQGNVHVDNIQGRDNSERKNVIIQNIFIEGENLDQLIEEELSYVATHLGANIPARSRPRYHERRLYLGTIIVENILRHINDPVVIRIMQGDELVEGEATLSITAGGTPPPPPINDETKITSVEPNEIEPVEEIDLIIKGTHFNNPEIRGIVFRKNGSDDTSSIRVISAPQLISNEQLNLTVKLTNVKVGEKYDIIFITTERTILNIKENALEIIAGDNEDKQKDVERLLIKIKNILGKIIKRIERIHDVHSLKSMMDSIQRLLGLIFARMQQIKPNNINQNINNLIIGDLGREGDVLAQALLLLVDKIKHILNNIEVDKQEKEAIITKIESIFRLVTELRNIFQHPPVNDANEYMNRVEHKIEQIVPQIIQITIIIQSKSQNNKNKKVFKEKLEDELELLNKELATLQGIVRKLNQFDNQPNVGESLEVWEAARLGKALVGLVSKRHGGNTKKLIKLIDEMHKNGTLGDFQNVAQKSKLVELRNKLGSLVEEYNKASYNIMHIMGENSFNIDQEGYSTGKNSKRQMKVWDNPLYKKWAPRMKQLAFEMQNAEKELIDYINLILKV